MILKIHLFSVTVLLLPYCFSCFHIPFYRVLVVSLRKSLDEELAAGLSPEVGGQ